MKDCACQMKQRVIAFIACLTVSSVAGAIQPVNVGLQPLYERIEAINGEQQLLNQRLQAEDTSARDRAMAYRQYKALEFERNQLAGQIVQARKLAQSPLVTFMAPGDEGQ